MSAAGAPTPAGRVARLLRNAGGGRVGPVVPILPANAPHALIWLTGVAAFVLAVAAFVLWGINGAATLFDMMVVLCT
jgi:hypothetical protein